VCLDQPSRADNFTITSSTISNTQVTAFPNDSVGCGIFPGTQSSCTPGNPLPIQESSMAGDFAWSAFQTGVAAGDHFNTSVDMFFSSDQANTSGPAAEVMVWANAQNEPVPSQAVKVTLGSKTYWRWTNPRTACSGACSWTETIYEVTPQRHGFPAGVPRKPILDNAVALGTLKSTDYEQYEGYGFEIWTGGTNLKVSAVTPTF
jgi:hypothetical protein